MLLSISLLVIIIAAFATLSWYINKVNREGKLTEKRRWIEQTPSLMSTLGVLGTFIGISVGLWHFDTNNLNDSIPHLLEGLKTAFITSIAGMVCSLILSKKLSQMYDNIEKGASDINIAAAQVTAAVRKMSETIAKQAQQQTTVQAAFYNTAQNLLQQIQSDQTTIVANTTQALTLQSSQTADLQNILKQASGMYELGGSINAYLATNQDIMREVNRNVGELANTIETMSSTQNEISDEVKSFGGKLHGEVVEIEGSMDRTNKLLSEKFDEFSRLLEKSNTEALVEVMKKVTEEFNKQMSELINRLVKENFDQLNKSVAQLNTWQQENKAMIESLTKQYKEMENDFERTSSTLVNVGEDTQALVADGSKLQKIVVALNKVMVDDERFVQMTQNLTKSAELTQQSMTEFKDAQSALNEWVRKQRDFVEAVMALIKQLEDISKINDYSEEFWKETRKGMNDSVNIVRQGSQSLMNDIKNLDGHFYNRLNTTLANLDSCIQKMMDNYN